MNSVQSAPREKTKENTLCSRFVFRGEQNELRTVGSTMGRRLMILYSILKANRIGRNN